VLLLGISDQGFGLNNVTPAAAGPPGVLRLDNCLIRPRDASYGLECSFYGHGACVGGVARFLFFFSSSVIVAVCCGTVIMMCGAVMSKRGLRDTFCFRSKRIHPVALALLR
jgi:hypothetical protein